MRQAGGGVSGAGRRGRRQRRGGEGGSHVAPADAVPPAQGGGGEGGVERHAAHPALDLLGPELALEERRTSGCSCSMMASVCTSVCPLGDSSSDPNSVSLSSSSSEQPSPPS
ncbi:hypothetical protein EYF80_017567 [Liparis tanakae]|uniref:Uncharacterized protein n=1 Tax=Liparis tanakae TaxID=230148 RepID=A0A4Z2I227_9TELE|nr:hypothetical protein EYF80_017567 [Liparis tanakae]